MASTAGREVILSRIRRALADQHRSSSEMPGLDETPGPSGSTARPDPQHAPIPRRYHRTHQADPAQRLAVFEDRLTDYGATVRRCVADHVAIEVASLVPAGSLLLIPADLDRTWIPTAWPTDRLLVDDGTLTPTQIDRADAVVTAAAAAIAETGTIALDGGSGQGRRVLSLVPDHHLCVVRVDQLVGGVPEAIGRLQPTRPLTWISGPSATSDIELSRVQGVHGPRRLDVIVVENNAPPGPS